MSADQAIDLLAEGFVDSEGPVWWKEGGYLLFSDIPNDRHMKWSPGEGVSEFRRPTDQANGLTRDLPGRLIACEHASRSVTRLEHDGSITVIANSFKGHRLNQPNDVVSSRTEASTSRTPGRVQRPGINGTWIFRAYFGFHRILAQ